MITSARYPFLSGGGEAAEIIAGFDWAATPLGSIESWPASLKSTIALVLRSPVPIVTLWGEDGIMIYNDAYSAFAGGRHPNLFGSKVREGWPEVADFNDNIMKVGLAGETLAYRDFPLTLYRHGGKPEQVWLNLDYSADRARGKRPNLKVLYTTGYTRNAIVHNGMLDPGTNLLTKPFSIEELAGKVRKILDEDA
jgi:hypothetical protein